MKPINEIFMELIESGYEIHAELRQVQLDDHLIQFRPTGRFRVGYPDGTTQIMDRVEFMTTFGGKTDGTIH